MKTYEQVIEFLFNQYPIYQSKGLDAYKPDLSNITSICKIIGNPEKKIKTIHVAGTNGKGSVCNYLANIYKESGYKIGLFTSPHLNDFRERISINSKYISKEFILDFYNKYTNEFKPISPSFFEWSTALAFKYFKEEQTDLNIIETGLGGRLDSTNIINPELSIITTIGLDHQKILGNTLNEIAKEKGGIIKNGIPILLGPDISTTKPVLEKIANEKKSILHITGKNNIIHEILPEYQLNNWQTALKAVNIIKEKYPVQLLENNPSKYLTIKGRWQVLAENPKVIADIGHNAQGMAAIKEGLQKEKYKKLHIVLGLSKDKDVSKILTLLPRADYYYITKSKNERSLDPKEIDEKINGKSEIFGKYSDAIKAAKTNAKANDLILITGSAFLVGDILADFL